MILFEKSIVLAATFLLIIFFISYIGIKFKKPHNNSITESLISNTSFNNDIYQKLKQDQNNFEKKIQKQLQQMQKQINNNTKGVNDYLKNKNNIQKEMKNLS